MYGIQFTALEGAIVFCHIIVLYAFCHAVEGVLNISKNLKKSKFYFISGGFVI